MKRAKAKIIASVLIGFQWGIVMTLVLSSLKGISNSTKLNVAFSCMLISVIAIAFLLNHKKSGRL